LIALQCTGRLSAGRRLALRIKRNEINPVLDCLADGEAPRQAIVF